MSKQQFQAQMRAQGRQPWPASPDTWVGPDGQAFKWKNNAAMPVLFVPEGGGQPTTDWRTIGTQNGQYVTQDGETLAHKGHLAKDIGKAALGVIPAVAALGSLGGASSTASGVAKTTGAMPAAYDGASNTAGGAASGSGDWLSKLSTVVGIAKGVGSAIGDYTGNANTQLGQDQLALQAKKDAEDRAATAARNERLSPWVNSGGAALADINTRMGRPSASFVAPTPTTPTAAVPVRNALNQATSLAQANGLAPTQPTSSTASQPPSGTTPTKDPQPGYVPVHDPTGAIRYVPPTDAAYWFAKLGTGPSAGMGA